MKTVMITGAGRGLGLELAKVFDAAGYRLILNCRTYPYHSNGDSQIVFGDLRDNETINALADMAEVMGVDILINCAGVYSNKEFDNLSVGDIESVMNSNFLAPVALAKRIFPMLQGRQGGYIVNINSLAGVLGAKGEMAYAASKHALRGFFDSLKFEATKHGIKILNVYAGAMKTDMTSNRQDQDKLIDPVEVAELIYALCKDYKTLNIPEITISRSNY